MYFSNTMYYTYPLQFQILLKYIYSITVELLAFYPINFIIRLTFDLDMSNIDFLVSSANKCLEVIDLYHPNAWQLYLIQFYELVNPSIIGCVTSL